ncbi:MAG: molybdopterin-binding protein [Chloroflexales bacterium]
MRLELLPLDAAAGHILCHNLADAQGRRVFAKGHGVRPQDLPRMAELGLRTVRVAVLEPDDVHENEAAHRLAVAVAGAGVCATPAHAGRANLRATYAGPLTVDADALFAINDLDGLTVATLASDSFVQPGRDLATIKIIPFAVPETDLCRAESIGQAAGGVLRVRPLRLHRIGVILVSSPAARLRVERGVYPAITGRVVALGGSILACHPVPLDASAVAEAVLALRATGAELIIIAGETSVMDLDDVTPNGIRRAGGRIEHYGAPVEPGNLLLLAYLNPPGDRAAPLPVLGTPGCVRSREANIVDLLLPRLMAGEHVRRRDIVALGHGGLLG